MVRINCGFDEEGEVWCGPCRTSSSSRAAAGSVALNSLPCRVRYGLRSPGGTETETETETETIVPIAAEDSAHLRALLTQNGITFVDGHQFHARGVKPSGTDVGKEGGGRGGM